MAETPGAQVAPIPPPPVALPTRVRSPGDDAQDDPSPLKAQAPEAPDTVLEELPDLSAAQTSPNPLETPTAQSTPEIGKIIPSQPLSVPSKEPFCRKVPKNKTKAKPVPKIDVIQPLAPALSAVSHPLATIPLAPAIGAAYPFPALANPNLLPHPFVSLPLQAPRRAVRIAPMGVLPLPPPGTAALVADFHAAAVVPDEPPRVQELSKAKRRGSTVNSVISEQALTPEERTRQKRMLRNRESAARSRDKRRNRNIQLQASTQRYRDKKKAMDEAIQELKLLCDTMRQTLEKHNIPVPP
ncbi:Basic-leucine zipper [Gracilaria domingensis]|nr:Basic-leucine zipper [Gracilaria domingensis]